MAKTSGVTLLQLTDDTIAAQMPSARNGIVIGLGLGVGLPWLLLSIIGTAVAVAMAPAEMRRNLVLGAFIVHVLLVLIHVLALAGVWLAFYGLGGTESIQITPLDAVLRRKALGITIPIKTGRTAYDRVELLDTSKAPGKTPHPRLELRAGHSAVRFGAGLTATQARELQGRIKSVLRGIGTGGSA